MADPKSTALTKRSLDSELMPPPPRPKRQKRPAKVLDEDVYTDALSHIIARDFYPGLLETEAQQEYLSALESNNNDWIREAGRKLTQVMTPGPEGRSRTRSGTTFTPRRTASLADTPHGYLGDTPQRTPKTQISEDFVPDVKLGVDVNMSLSAFQAKYTSEDNESFNELLDKQNAARTAKYAFFHHGNKIPSSRQIAYRTREQNLIEHSTGTAASTALITVNAAGDVRKLVSSNGGPSQDLDVRPAAVESFSNRQGPRNNFMFGPDSVEDTHLTRAQAAEQKSNAPPMSVAYAATRFSDAAKDKEELVPPSPSMSAIDAAIAGRPRLSQSETGSEGGYSGAETPRVNGYAFVDAEPTLSEMGTPITDEEADVAEREAAMRLLPQVEEGGPNPFNIRSRSRREDLHHRLVEKADATRRQERNGGAGSRLEQLRNLGVTPASGRTPTPRFTSGPTKTGKGSMTPAARRLAERIGTPRKETSVFADKKQLSSTPRAKRLV